MSAVNFNQQPIIAGQKIGVSPLFAALLWLIIIGLTMMNIYHIDNFLVSKLTDASTSFLFIWILHIISVSAALLEVPLAKSIVTNYRLHGFNSNVFLQSLFTLVIASMAVIGGINSQLTDADKRDTQINSYESTLSTFDSKKRSLESARDAHKLQANNIKDRNSRAIEKARADSDYYAAISKLDYSKAGHQATRPTRAIETGSTLHWVTITLFSLVCSFGVIFVSGFMAVYYQSLVSLPAFSLMSKANHAWSSSGADFVTSKHEISPLNNRMEGFAKVEKSTIQPTQNQDTENRPALDETRVDGQNGASGRTLNADTKGGTFSLSQYNKLKGEILAGNLPPTVRAIKAWLRTNKVGDTDKTRSGITDRILSKMKEENLIILNPEQGKTDKILAKYVLNPDYQNKEPVLEREGDKMISSICPECQHQSRVSESNLAKWGGMVGCPECAASYTVKDHQVKPETKRPGGIIPAAGLGVSIDENGISPTAIIGAGMVRGRS